MTGNRWTPVRYRPAPPEEYYSGQPEFLFYKEKTSAQLTEVS